jgi:HEAT repeat protein
MSIEVAAELWGELKRYVNTVDREEAAESVVALLIDNDYDADEIRDAFKGDSDIKRALAAYVNGDVEEEPEDEEEYDDTDWED